MTKLPVTPVAYRARLDNWHQHSGVHNGLPRSSGGGDSGKGGLPFSPDLVPLARHPQVVARGPDAAYAVLAHHLYRFCRFTEHLELEAVVPSCVGLRLGSVPFAVPEGLARDAGRVAIDETWHAECAGDLVKELQEAVGVAPTRPRHPAFMDVLVKQKALLPPGKRHLADTAFVSVSETLITGALLRVPRDERVIERVREVLGEHAREEAYHHAIFSQVIGVMWEQLDVDERDLVGPLFAEFIDAFLRPDRRAEGDALKAIGFTAEEAKRILLESGEDGAEETRRTLAKAASPTIRAMRQHRLLEHATTTDRLQKLGLLA